MTKSENRVYHISDAVTFQKNNEPFGELSNMATDFPIVVNDIYIPTNEGLYQACKYPDFPEHQKAIIDQKSPMGAKFAARKFSNKVRADWSNVKVDVMRWCLRVKMVQHWDKFSKVLLSTEQKTIVEVSKIDMFWAAKLQENGSLYGKNVLGRLLMELREMITREGKEMFLSIDPLPIEKFFLYNEQIRTVFPIVNNLEDVNIINGNLPLTPPDQLTLPF